MENPINRSYQTKLMAHSPDVADAIEFLVQLSKLLLDEDLKRDIESRRVIFRDMLRSHPTSSFLPRKLLLVRFIGSYKKGRPHKCVADIPHLKKNSVMLKIDKLVDNLLEKMSDLLVTFNSYADNKHNDFSCKLQQLWNTLTYLKPLARYVTEFLKGYTGDDLAPIFDVLEGVTGVIYLVIIFKTSDPMSMFFGMCQLLEVTNIEQMYLTTLRIPTSDLPESLSVATVPSKLYLIDNLTKLLLSNLVFPNDANPNWKLYEDLVFLETSIINLNDGMRLTKLHCFEESLEDIYCKAIPLICSFYEEEIAEDMHREFKGAVIDALNQIKLLNSEFQKIKLHNYPKTDYLGFMELFLGYLQELLEDKHIPVLEKDIHRLHCEVYSLMFFPKVTQEKLGEYLWAHIMRLVYEAEYVIDLFMVRPSDSNLISSLSDIIDQLKHTREKIILEYLIEGDKDTNVILVIELPSTLLMSLRNASTVVHHFDIRVRCPISNPYQKRETLLQILGDVIGHQNDISLLTTEKLIEKLCISLDKWRYLIILEDMWDIEPWNDLRQHLPENRSHSRILITTRHL